MKPSEIQIREILHRLKRRFPQPGAMEFGGAYPTIIAVLLSARTRDEQVLQLMPAFLRAFPTVQDLAQADVDTIASYINTIGMYKQKARRLQGLAKRVCEEYDGEIPRTMDALTSLPGVGRKTASVVLPLIFQQSAIAVDTHVHRVTNRLGWVKTKQPAQTERALLKLIPADCTDVVNQVFVKFGRYICLPGKPRCYMCPVRDMCPVAKKNEEMPKNIDQITADIERREEYLQTLRKEIESTIAEI